MSTAILEAPRPNEAIDTNISDSKRRGFSLLVSNDEIVAASVREIAQRFNVMLRARTQEQAFSMLTRSASWAGIVVDLNALAPNVVAGLERLRSADPLVPMLAIGNSHSRELVNALQMLRAEPVIRPLDPANLIRFMQRALAMGWLPDERVAAWVDTEASARKLTSREVQLLVYSLGGESRAQMMRRLGISENTLKSQVRCLLRKCGVRNLDALAVKVLRESLIFEREDISGVYGSNDGIPDEAPRPHVDVN